jgi:hypothetical protein
VVLMVPLIGAGRPCIGGSTGGRAAAEEEGSPALRSGGFGAQERVWMGRGVSANDGDAVCVQDRGWCCRSKPTGEQRQATRGAGRLPGRLAGPGPSVNGPAIWRTPWLGVARRAT